MIEKKASHNSKLEPTSNGSSKVSNSKQAFIETRKAFLQLEAMDISDFEIFNALAGLYYERGDSEVSELLAEVAYKCFQKA